MLEIRVLSPHKSKVPTEQRYNAHWKCVRQHFDERVGLYVEAKATKLEDVDWDAIEGSSGND